MIEALLAQERLGQDFREAFEERQQQRWMAQQYAGSNVIVSRHPTQRGLAGTCETH